MPTFGWRDLAFRSFIEKVDDELGREGVERATGAAQRMVGALRLVHTRWLHLDAEFWRERWRFLHMGRAGCWCRGWGHPSVDCGCSRHECRTVSDFQNGGTPLPATVLPGDTGDGREVGQTDRKARFTRAAPEFASGRGGTPSELDLTGWSRRATKSRSGNLVSHIALIVRAA